MLNDFASRFDAHYDLRLYHQCSGYGYRYEGDYRVWEPQDESDLESVTPAYPPGAMAVGEVDNFYYDANDEF